MASPGRRERLTTRGLSPGRRFPLGVRRSARPAWCDEPRPGATAPAPGRCRHEGTAPRAGAHREPRPGPGRGAADGNAPETAASSPTTTCSTRRQRMWVAVLDPVGPTALAGLQRAGGRGVHASSVDEAELIHVVVRRGARYHRFPGVTIHESRRFDPRDVQHRDWLPCLPAGPVGPRRRGLAAVPPLRVRPARGRRTAAAVHARRPVRAASTRRPDPSQAATCASRSTTSRVAPRR